MGAKLLFNKAAQVKQIAGAKRHSDAFLPWLFAPSWVENQAGGDSLGEKVQQSAHFNWKVQSRKAIFSQEVSSGE